MGLFFDEAIMAPQLAVDIDQLSIGAFVEQLLQGGSIENLNTLKR